MFQTPGKENIVFFLTKAVTKVPVYAVYARRVIPKL